VAKPEQLPLVADTLARSSGGSGAVVHGAGGYDELTTLGKASLVFVRDGKTRPGVLDPAAYGFSPCTEKDLAVRDPEDAAGVLRELLRGKGPEPMRDMLIFNLGFALYLLEPENGEAWDPVCGFAPRRMREAMDKARQAIDAGAGRSFCRA
jgi:anthranilate phosphoribosyltransferase